MTSQDIKKQLKEPHFWNIVLTGQHAEPRTKAMLEAKGIITWLPLAPVRRQWGRILKTRVRDKDCVKNRVKRAKIVRFTLC